LPGPGYLVRLAASMASAMVPINLNRAAAVIDIAAIIAATISGIASNKSSYGSSFSSSVPTAITSAPPAQRTFASPVGATIFTQPTLTQTQLNNIPNQNLLTAADIAAALNNLPAPIVTVEDINARTVSKRKIEVRANI